MGRGKAKFPEPWKGKAVSVYLKGEAYAFLEHEIDRRTKPVKGSSGARVVPKGLSIPILVRACVEYVIDEDKLECILPSFKRYS